MDRRNFMIGGTSAVGLHLTGQTLFAQSRSSALDRVLAQLKRAKAAVGSGRISNSSVSGKAPAPEQTVDLRRQGHSPRSLAMSAFLIVNSTRWYFGNDEGAGRSAIQGLEAWANADAHSDVLASYKGSSSRWPTYGLMTATLNSLFLLHNHTDLTEERRDVIFDWIDRTFKRSWLLGQLPSGGAGYKDKEQRVNNHNARRALAQLYLGIHRGETSLIRKSSSNLQRTISAIDKTGAPFDANRGDWALRYVNFGLDSAIMHQTFLWLADPSALRSSTLSKLDAAGNFLFSETLQQSKIHEYAKENIGRPQSSYEGRQDMDWIDRHDGGFLWWAYVDSPIFRGSTPNAFSAAKRALGKSSSWRTVKYSDTGGAVSLWFAA